MLANIKEFFTHDEKKIRDDRWIFTSMLVGAILSLIASFVLSMEAVELARNPDAVLACSVNAVLNCATVGLHPSAALFGFPNSFFIIGALCPWCLLVTATTTFVWFAITRYNVREDNLYLSKEWSAKAKRLIEKDYDKLALFSIVFVLVVAILVKYGNALFA